MGSQQTKPKANMLDPPINVCISGLLLFGRKCYYSISGAIDTLKLSQFEALYYEIDC